MAAASCVFPPGDVAAAAPATACCACVTVAVAIVEATCTGTIGGAGATDGVTTGVVPVAVVVAAA